MQENSVNERLSNFHKFDSTVFIDVALSNYTDLAPTGYTCPF